MLYILLFIEVVLRLAAAGSLFCSLLHKLSFPSLDQHKKVVSKILNERHYKQKNIHIIWKPNITHSHSELTPLVSCNLIVTRTQR